MLAAAPLASWAEDATYYPLTVLACMGRRYDRNGFLTNPRRSDDE